MAVSAMLEQNPTRQVVFLVDRVLLVIQQSQYLINEIGDRVYHRYDLAYHKLSMHAKYEVSISYGSTVI